MTDYKATFKTVGKTFNAKGNTPLEAIQNLKPDIAKAHGILTMQKGDKKVERVLPRIIVMRLFGPGSKAGKEIALKHLSILFDTL